MVGKEQELGVSLQKQVDELRDLLDFGLSCQTVSLHKAARLLVHVVVLSLASCKFVSDHQLVRLADVDCDLLLDLIGQLVEDF